MAVDRVFQMVHGAPKEVTFPATGVPAIETRVKALEEKLKNLNPWNIFPPHVPIPVLGVTFGGSDGRRAIMPGELEARENWVICDGGSDGAGGIVPDLRGRMIMGASDARPAGSTGGSETHEHSLSGTVGATTLSVGQLAAHGHTAQLRSGYWDNFGQLPEGQPYGSGVAGRTTRVSEQSHNTGSNQPHTHSLAADTGPASSMPPYYALALIMRCA
ncbi:hypothetical protein [uncultured Desulfovibrio sp.]|uniref:hypothetical protein n=1 Tax=uncultured Desulfovibrio sp. TaxID=167968 RepID=UPI002670B1F6|nr:hypothetical protein [uncultured Desulfovibrio sp.]